jgi:hypothetical protein
MDFYGFIFRLIIFITQETQETQGTKLIKNYYLAYAYY